MVLARPGCTCYQLCEGQTEKKKRPKRVDDWRDNESGGKKSRGGLEDKEGNRTQGDKRESENGRGEKQKRRGENGHGGR